MGIWEELGTRQREGLGTGLGVRGIGISSTELSEDDSGRRAGLGMRRRGLGTGLGVRGVVTSNRELTEDGSESLKLKDCHQPSPAFLKLSVHHQTSLAPLN